MATNVVVYNGNLSPNVHMGQDIGTALNVWRWIYGGAFSDGVNRFTAADVVNIIDEVRRLDLNNVARLDSPNFIGIPTVPTPMISAPPRQITNVEWVLQQLANYAPLLSPELQGVPTAPTPVDDPENPQPFVIVNKEYLQNSLQHYVKDDNPNLYDPREPENHAERHAVDGIDPISPESIGAVSADDERLANPRTPTVHAESHSQGSSDPLIGYASLDGSGKLSMEVMPPGVIKRTWEVPTYADLATLTSATVGDYAVVLTGAEADNKYTLIGDDPTILSNWLDITNSGGVVSINGKEGIVTIDLADLPGVQQALGLKANTASPAFSGNPTVPTQAATDNSTRAANTAFVKGVAGLYLPLAGGTLSGGLVLPATANIGFGSGIGDKLLLYSTTFKIGVQSSTMGLYVPASSAFRFYADTSERFRVDASDIYIGNGTGVQTQLNTKAPLASPALTGNPTAPTQAVGNRTTRIATTAFVGNAVDNALVNVGGFTTRQVVTNSGNWTVPKTGYYRVTCIGGGGAGGGASNRGGVGGGTTSFGSHLSAIGGGGGGGGSAESSTACGGGGGGGAGVVQTAYIQLTAGASIPVVIGAGGIASTAVSTTPTGSNPGSNGGTAVAYIAGSGGGGGGVGGAGGSATHTGNYYGGPGGSGGCNGSGYGGGGGGGGGNSNYANALVRSQG